MKGHMTKRILALVLTVILATSSIAAWSWSQAPVDRPIDARSTKALSKSLEALKEDLSGEDFQQLFSAISWITFYEGTIIGVGGRYDPRLGVQRACAVINEKSARQVCEHAAKLAKEAPKILEAYKRWLAAGSP